MTGEGTINVDRAVWQFLYHVVAHCSASVAMQFPAVRSRTACLSTTFPYSITMNMEAASSSDMSVKNSPLPRTPPPKKKEMTFNDRNGESLASVKI